MRSPFLQMMAYIWPYKWRVLLSLVLAASVAGLYCANITAAYPFLQVLFKSKDAGGVRAWATEKADAWRADALSARAAVAAARAQIELASDPAEASDARDRMADEQDREDKAWFWADVWTRLTPYVPVSGWALLKWILILLVVANGVKGILAFVQHALVGHVVQSAMVDLRKRFYHQTLRLSLGHFGEQGTSDTLARFTNDVETVGRGIRTAFVRLVTEPLKMIGALAVAMFLSWQLTVIALILAPTAGGVIGLLGKLMKRASKRALETMAGVYKVLQETFLGIKIVKAFTMERYERRRFNDELRRLYRRNMRIVKIEAASPQIIEFLGVAALAMAMAGGGYLVLEGTTTLAGIPLSDHPLTAPELLTFYALLAAMVDPVRKCSSFYNRIKNSSAAAERILQFMNHPPEAEDDRRLPALPRHAKAVEFQGVTFSYDGRRNVLEGVDLSVEYGETIALVGPSGSGKSTLVNLIPRFYQPQGGRILVDGQDTSQVRLRSLRRQIGLVTQEPMLFEDTVAHNIRYGDPHATQQRVEAAARAAYAHDFIADMPDGYETNIGELGGSLSGGQRQRLTVARAILRDPAILILDEATSSLDSESERLLQKALDDFTKDRTTFVIAHRLSTIERADRIVVLDQGRVEAVGTHTELLDASPIYKRLHQIQFGRANGETETDAG